MKIKWGIPQRRNGVVACWHAGVVAWQRRVTGTSGHLGQAVVMVRHLCRAFIARAWCGSLSPTGCMVGGACRLLGGGEGVGEQIAF